MSKRKAKKLAKQLNISENRSLEAFIKANLISKVQSVMKKQKLTHSKVAKLSGLSRSTVTGILSGSLQRVSIDRILRMVEAVGLMITEIKIKEAA